MAGRALTAALPVRAPWWLTGMLLTLVLLAMTRSAVAQDPFAIPPLPEGQAVPARYFGIHIHNLMLRGRVQDPPQPTPFPSGWAGGLRLWDAATRWAELQPERDQWVFERLDRYVATAEANGAQIILTLGSTPRWASARPDEPCSYGFGCSAEPADMADWTRYIERVASRYRGRIAYYEVWNEPHPGERFAGHRGFFTGDMATLLRLATEARTVLSRVDPQAQLLSPAFTNRLPVLDAYLAAGGAALADGLAYHLYGRDDRHILSQVRSLRQIMARHGLADRPLLNTESSFDRHPPLDGDTAAALHVRVMVLGAFLGVEAWYLHGWDNEDNGAVDRQLRPTPLMGPYQQVHRWLLGLQPRGCRSLSPSMVRCDGQRGDERVALLWQHQAMAAPEAWSPGPGEQVLRVEASGPGLPAPGLPQAGPWSIGRFPVAVWWRPAP